MTRNGAPVHQYFTYLLKYLFKKSKYISRLELDNSIKIFVLLSESTQIVIIVIHSFIQINKIFKKISLNLDQSDDLDMLERQPIILDLRSYHWHQGTKLCNNSFLTSAIPGKYLDFDVWACFFQVLNIQKLLASRIKLSIISGSIYFLHLGWLCKYI